MYLETKSGGDLEAIGNQMADEAAKEVTLPVEVPIFNLAPVLSPPPTTPKFCGGLWRKKHL
jgi:hypothetical protein